MIYTYNSSMAGAPVLSGTAGALRAVLKACLVDGFGAGAAASLTVASGVATLMFSAAHPYNVGTIMQVAGATTSGLNGSKRVLSITTDRVTFAAPGIADGAASGSITHKVAPAGWQELFAGQLANVIALKPAVPEATGCVLRVDDTGSTAARVRCYESMSDISSGTGPTPADTQVSGGLWWPKSSDTGSAAKTWRLFADDRAFYIWTQPYSPTNAGVLLGMGDFISDVPGDGYGAFIAGMVADNLSYSAIHADLAYGSFASVTEGVYIVRGPSGIGGAVRGRKTAAYNTASGYSGTQGYSGGSLVYPYPNQADNSLRVTAVDLAGEASGFRGRIAGVMHTPQRAALDFVAGQTIDGQGLFAGRSFMALRCGGPAYSITSDNVGVAFIDLVGPWRS